MDRKKVFFLLFIVILLITFYLTHNIQEPSRIYSAESLPELGEREDLGNLLEALGFKSAIEVGVFKGEFAEKLLKKWPSFNVYYGVDPYIHQPNYKELTNVKPEEQDSVYQTAKKRLEIFGSRVNFIRMSAIEGATKFKKNSIDFVYLDGRHDYCSVMEELLAYYPILKCGGIMAGHDFVNVFVNDQTDWTICPNGEKVTHKGGGVKGTFSIVLYFLFKFLFNSFLGAVLEFIEKNNIKSFRTTKNSWPSFYFFKEC